MVTVEEDASYEDDEVRAAAEREVAEQLEQAGGEVQEQLERAERIWQDPKLQRPADGPDDRPKGSGDTASSG